MSGFHFVIAFPIKKQLAFVAIHSIFENLFNFPFLLFSGIDADRFFGGGFRKSWESFGIWSKVDSKMAAMDPRVMPCMMGGMLSMLVIVFVWAFKE